MVFPTLTIDAFYREICPQLRLGCMLHEVRVTETNQVVESEIDSRLQNASSSLDFQAIHEIKPLFETRSTYRKLGKDPSRYRPSAEALMRRLVSGKTLYRVNNVVDSLNLISVESGFSIGGYDASLITGQIVLGAGKTGEPYNAIGRGELNIEGLPVLGDEVSAFGSPTSDSVRTMVSVETRHFLSVFFDFGGNSSLQTALQAFDDLLQKYCDGNRLELRIIRV